MILDFFRRREYKMPKPVNYIAPPKPETPDAIYTIGATAEGTHMTFKVGYNTLTMTKAGCQNLIDQLEVFKNQLSEE